MVRIQKSLLRHQKFIVHALKTKGNDKVLKKKKMKLRMVSLFTLVHSTPFPTKQQFLKTRNTHHGRRKSKL